MKELIDKLARGTIEYELPKLEVSVSEIDTTLYSEKISEGSFEVYSSNDIEVKGMVYSSHEFVTIKDRSFSGKSNIIHYSIDAEYLNEGDVVEGDINIISNGGEAIIPFRLKIDSASMTSSIGEIKNLFHFANLVQMNYDEALSLFKSPDFVHIFLEDDFYLMSMYEGLKSSPVPEMAMEEFLIAANKKNPTRIAISDTYKEYEGVDENQGDVIVISKENWGYTQIDVIIDGDFLSVEKSRITSDDFAGSNYELKYYVHADRLHGGNNYGTIRFVTKTQCERFVVSVKGGSKLHDTGKIYKRSICDIFKKYIDFRVHRLDMDDWADDTLSIIERMRSASDEYVFMKLLQAQVCISKGMEADASWLLESAAERLFEHEDRDMELYCYYLYVRTIQKRNPEFTEEIIEKIKNIYTTDNSSWRILWILFYLDESYDNNVTIKLTRIKEQFAKGMKSPLMYFEAMSIFNEQPALLRVIDEFELQTLNFGSRQGMISRKLAEQVADLAQGVKSFNKLLFSVLAELYDTYGTKSILSAIVGMLIKGNKTQSRYFLWYEEAVNEELKLTSLYEYFMYSLPEDYNRPLPQLVLLYFGYNSGMPNEKLALVYENVIRFRNELEAVYRNYESQIERFAAGCLEQGIIDEHIAVVYRVALKNAMITPETADILPGVLNTYLIKCSQKNIREVIIIHKEMTDIHRYPVVAGKAYVEIYTEDAAIIFKDTEGMCYGKSVDYTMKKLLNMEEYLELCFEMTAKNDWLILYKADKYLKYRKHPERTISILKYLVYMDGVREEYRNYVAKDIVDYYSSNYDLDAVDDYLYNADGRKFGTKPRIKLIELMIVRGMYERAFELMKEYGYSFIDAGRLLRCVSKLMDITEMQYDEGLMYMALYAYRKGKYNENTLKYLCMYYNGTASELYDIWKSCKAYDYENRNLEENLIACILYTGAKAAHIGEIYQSYAEKGAGEKIRRAFLFAKAYDYFVKEKVVDERVFDYIYRDIVVDNPIHDTCRLAYAKYCSQKPELCDRERDICRDIVFDMCKIGKVFEFYKDFSKYFNLPVSIIDKKIVEYHTNPKNKVLIHYNMDESDITEQNYTIKEMRDVCGGIFVQEFVLFYGESIQYYITEEYDGQQSLTESSSATLSDTNVSEISDRESRYTMLNDMMVSFEMHEETTLSEMAGEYMIMSKLTDSIFKLV